MYIHVHWCAVSLLNVSLSYTLVWWDKQSNLRTNAGGVPIVTMTMKWRLHQK